MTHANAPMDDSCSNLNKHGCVQDLCVCMTVFRHVTLCVCVYISKVLCKHWNYVSQLARWLALVSSRISVHLCGSTILPHLHEKGCQTNTISCFSPSLLPHIPLPPSHYLPPVSTALIAIGQYSSTIETVDAGWCKDITDQGATQIAQSSKSLRYLGLMRCDKVTRLGP